MMDAIVNDVELQLLRDIAHRDNAEREREIYSSSIASTPFIFDEPQALQQIYRLDFLLRHPWRL